MVAEGSILKGRVEEGINGRKSLFEDISDTNSYQLFLLIKQVEAGIHRLGLNKGFELFQAGRVHIAIAVPGIDVLLIQGVGFLADEPLNVIVLNTPPSSNIC